MDKKWQWKTPRGESREMVLEVAGDGYPQLWLTVPRRKLVGGAGSKVKPVPPKVRKQLGLPDDWAALSSGLVAPKAILEEAVAEARRLQKERKEAETRAASAREAAIKAAYDRLPPEAQALLAEAARLDREASEWLRDPEGDGVALSIASRAAALRRKAQALCPHEVVDESESAPRVTYTEVAPGQFAEVERRTITRTCAVCGWSEEKVVERVLRPISKEEFWDWLMR